MIRVRELREARGLQQKELAIDLCVSQPTISDWESGRKVPSAKSTQKLADYFGVSIDYLLGREEKQGTFPSVGKWTVDMNEDFDNADDETRTLILTRWGYDPDHVWAAHRYFPWQFSDKKEPTPVSEDGQNLNIIKIAGRDGSRIERKLTDEQIAALKLIIDQLPDADDL